MDSDKRLTFDREEVMALIAAWIANRGTPHEGVLMMALAHWFWNTRAKEAGTKSKRKPLSIEWLRKTGMHCAPTAMYDRLSPEIDRLVHYVENSGTARVNRQ